MAKTEPEDLGRQRYRLAMLALLTGDGGLRERLAHAFDHLNGLTMAKSERETYTLAEAERLARAIFESYCKLHGHVP